MKKPPPPDKRWKPGQSGNPGGKPKKDLDLTKTLSGILAEPHGNTRLSKLEKICRVVVGKAVRGHQQSIQFVIERMFGRLKMTVDATVQAGEIEKFLRMSESQQRAYLEKLDRQIQSSNEEEESEEDEG